MENKEILRRIDHTFLKPRTSVSEIFQGVNDALEYEMASICVPPSMVKQVRRWSSDIHICTVIGFPVGYSTTYTKEKEIEEARVSGADEFDVVINLLLLSEKRFDLIAAELKRLRIVADDGGIRTLKVIIETGALTTEEKIQMCAIVSAAKADYIKTSTGFNYPGAELTDIDIFKKYCDPHIKIKASGSIKTKSDMEAFIAAGAARIGTSSAAILFPKEGEEG